MVRSDGKYVPSQKVEVTEVDVEEQPYEVVPPPWLCIDRYRSYRHQKIRDTDYGCRPAKPGDIRREMPGMRGPITSNRYKRK